MKIGERGILFIFLFLIVSSNAQIISSILLIADVLSWSLVIWDAVKAGHNMMSMTDSCDDSHYQEQQYNLVTSKIFQTVSRISSQLDGISQLINDRTNELNIIIKKLGLEIDINRRMDNLIQIMDIIENRYEDLIRPMMVKKKVQMDTKKQCRFAYRQLYEDLLSEKVNSMYRIIMPFRDLQTSLLTEIHQDFEINKDKLCGTGHSALDYLQLIYTSVMIVEIKAFMMTTFSHHILFRNNGTGQKCEYFEMNPDDEIRIEQTKLRERLHAYSKKFLNVMEGASKEFRACDRGNDFNRDETYFELEGTIQTIIQPPTDEKQLLGCKNIIHTYGTPSIYCNQNSGVCTTPLTRNCLGHIHTCQAPSKQIYGCIAENSPRRYEWIKWEGNTTSAQDSLKNCPEKFMIESRTSIIFRHSVPDLRNPLMWKPCLCECNDNDVDSLSTHILNLQWVKSDLSKNMVITGIRFIVKHQIMQFQIQQGRLAANFKIKESFWKPVEDISEEIRAARLSKRLRGKSPGVAENKDYLVLKQKVNDEINFDTLNVSYPHVLTGVRLFFWPRITGGVGRIQIAIEGTKFDHVTGQLCRQCDPEIVISQKRHMQRYNYPRENVKSPKFPTIPIIPHDQYIRIDRSDLIHDSGQTTLPYFDALPLASNPPFPLGGLGIFHKGASDFTGFISLKFVSLDYSTYIRKSVDEVEKQKELFRIPIKD